MNLNFIRTLVYYSIHTTKCPKYFQNKRGVNSLLVKMKLNTIL